MFKYVIDDSYTPSQAEVLTAIEQVAAWYAQKEAENRTWLSNGLPYMIEHAGNGLSGDIYINIYHEQGQEVPSNTWCAHRATYKYNFPKIVF